MVTELCTDFILQWYETHIMLCNCMKCRPVLILKSQRHSFSQKNNFSQINKFFVLYATYNGPILSGSSDILFTMFHMFTMTKSKKEHNSAMTSATEKRKKYWILTLILLDCMQSIQMDGYRSGQTSPNQYAPSTSLSGGA